MSVDGRPTAGSDELGAVAEDSRSAVEEPASYEFAGTPDAFQRLWTPHRMVYIGGEGKPSSAEERHCPFCDVPKRSDADGLIVGRGENVYAVLNLYPYNPGHLMVVPYRHFADYTDLTEAESTELVHFVQRAMRVLRAVANPQGFNIGVNQGVVGGDMNFMPVVGNTRVLPQLLSETQQMLAAAWDQHG